MPELSIERMRRRWQAADFAFAHTDDLPPLAGLVGQERAIKALELGLRMKSPGYNIFVAGPAGTGKTSYSRSLVSRWAHTQPPADDWVYVHNFDRPDEPRALRLPSGTAPKFARSVEDMVGDLQAALARTLDSKEHEERKQELIKQTQEQIRAVVSELQQSASEKGFTIKQGQSGLVTVPLHNGQPLSEEEFHELEEVHRNQIARDAEDLSEAITSATRQMYELEKALQERLSTLDRRIAAAAITPVVARVRTAYRQVPEVGQYLEQLKHDALENLPALRRNGSDDEDGGPSLPMAMLMPRPRRSDPLARYRVNVLCTRAAGDGAPVVTETNPTYGNLFGKVEYSGQTGEPMTDIGRIKAGAVHRANGGYLILQAIDVLRNPSAWEAIKRCLANREIRIEPPPEQMRLVPLETYRPEPIPCDVKVVLIGTPALYHTLYEMDENFRKLFKLLAQFDTVMPATAENVHGYASFIASLCRRDGLCHLEASAVARVLEYSHRLAGDQQKLSAQFNEIVDVISEAATWAALGGSDIVGAEHVDRAVAAKAERSGLAEDRTRELIERGQILVDVDGDVVGQVNGLVVMHIGEYAFGAPSRITAAVHMGRQGIVHIERETQMSGQIHDKGVLTLAGFLGDRFAQDHPLSLSASLSFEQTYVPVDGDSASSTELYALLSALAEVPIHQGIAVTGSVNQRGQVQPIGGVNEKVEGFFRICRVKGLTGRQGVIIPAQNAEHLMLAEDVLAAVAAGQFHIWAVSSIDEGIEIMTGMSAGSINARVSERLANMARGLMTWWRRRR